MFAVARIPLRLVRPLPCGMLGLLHPSMAQVAIVPPLSRHSCLDLQLGVSHTSHTFFRVLMVAHT
jgi:hypothetical protein